MQNEEPEVTRCYHTILGNLSPVDETLLQSCATILSKVERSIFASYQAGKTDIKSDFQATFGITARHFNGCKSEVEGLVNANLTILQNRIIASKEAIKTLSKIVKQLEKSKTPNWYKLHHKKRKLATKMHRLAQLEDDLANKRVRVAFGSKKLFRSQYHLEENGFASKEEWDVAWQRSRDRQFFLVGSKDESCGNQSCQMVENQDGTFDLYLRLPNVLVTPTQAKIIHLRNIRFPYGYEVVSAALNSNLERSQTTNKEAKKLLGQALSFRFYRDDQDRWKLFVITD